MNSIKIFVGPKTEFEKTLPANYKILTQVAKEIDDKRRIHEVRKSGDTSDITKIEIKAENLVIFSNEYYSVSEHVVTNFVNFLSDVTIDANLYIQNPPRTIMEQLELSKKKFDLQEYKYCDFTEKHLKQLNSDFEKYILGQQDVKTEFQCSLFSHVKNKKEKPLVVLFYGNSGLGKTATAKLLAKIVGEKLFRQQFSMLQNNQSFTYIYGGKHNEESFAKDLLDRQSNIILLDEFDKAHPAFFNAFYEMFDEGVYNDTKYSVKLNKSIIICTSNYLSFAEISQNLGAAIVSRFDALIEFKPFNLETKHRIAEKCYDSINSEYSKEEQVLIQQAQVLDKLKSQLGKIFNARKIEKLTRHVISQVLIEKLLTENPTCNKKPRT